MILLVWIWWHISNSSSKCKFSYRSYTYIFWLFLLDFFLHISWLLNRFYFLYSKILLISSISTSLLLVWFYDHPISLQLKTGMLHNFSIFWQYSSLSPLCIFMFCSKRIIKSVRYLNRFMQAFSLFPKNFVVFYSTISLWGMSWSKRMNSSISFGC